MFIKYIIEVSFKVAIFLGTTQIYETDCFYGFCFSFGYYVFSFIAYHFEIDYEVKISLHEQRIYSGLPRSY